MNDIERKLAKSMAHFVSAREWEGYKRGVQEAAQLAQAQLAQRDAALKAADNVSDAFEQLEQLGCQQSAARLSLALASYRKARGQDA